MKGTISRVERAVCDYFTLGRACGARKSVKTVKP